MIRGAIRGARARDGRLEEAVAAYRAALEEMTPQTDPTNYQLTMKDLNQVLTLQKKKSRKEGSRALIKTYEALSPLIYKGFFVT